MFNVSDEPQNHESHPASEEADTSGGLGTHTPENRIVDLGFPKNLLDRFVCPPPLVLAESAIIAVFTRVLLLLVLANAAATAVFALVPHPLVFADAAAAAVFARGPPPFFSSSSPLSLFLPASLPLSLPRCPR